MKKCLECTITKSWMLEDKDTTYLPTHDKLYKVQHMITLGFVDDMITICFTLYMINMCQFIYNQHVSVHI